MGGETFGGRGKTLYEAIHRVAADQPLGMAPGRLRLAARQGEQHFEDGTFMGRGRGTRRTEANRTPRTALKHVARATHRPGGHPPGGPAGSIVQARRGGLDRRLVALGESAEQIKYGTYLVGRFDHVAYIAN